jgi:GH25 family lysozyme M1 (1,4-beta-N-acetylmuramidase)
MTASGAADHNQGTPATGTVDSGAETTTLADATDDEMVEGVDLSHWNRGDSESYDWEAATADGVRFAIFKATEGGVDPHLADNWRALRDAQARGTRIAMGTYHLLVPPDGKHWGKDDPVPPLGAPDADSAIEVQAQRYLDALDACGGLQRGDLPPALDIESKIMNRVCECFATSGKRPDGYDQDKPWSWIARWCELVERGAGCKPMLYVRCQGHRGLARLEQYASHVGSSDPFGTLRAYDLWIVDYSHHSEPSMPDPADWSTWRLRQYTDAGRVDGIPDDGIDRDRFNGNEERFDEWLASLSFVYIEPFPD